MWCYCHFVGEDTRFPQHRLLWGHDCFTFMYPDRLQGGKNVNSRAFDQNHTGVGFETTTTSKTKVMYYLPGNLFSGWLSQNSHDAALQRQESSRGSFAGGWLHTVKSTHTSDTSHDRWCSRAGQVSLTNTSLTASSHLLEGKHKALTQWLTPRPPWGSRHV